jgi:methylase of polypeptide subunit release factors
MDSQQHALIGLGRKLYKLGYRFTAVTPNTHHIVAARLDRPPSLASIFGWNQHFRLDEIESDIVDALERAGALEHLDGYYRSGVRFASIDNFIFAHSAFPTVAKNAVFFGPDTHRFVRLLRSSLADLSEKSKLRLVDVGCGSGAGGLLASRLLGPETELILADINPTALYYSAVNAAINKIPASTRLSDTLDRVEGDVDVVIANPPYLVDDEKRIYRHGGGQLGLAIAQRIVENSMIKLSPGGRLVLYTGTPIINGSDAFFQAVRPLLQLYGPHFVYEEIDPDVFSEELVRPAYAKADRIAVIGLTIFK